MVLVGRKKPSAEALELINRWQEAGAKVKTVALDISDAREVTQFMDQFSQSFSLKGIVHSAGVLDDGLLMQQNFRRYETVMTPKITGLGIYKRRLRRKIDLDFFVSF